VTNTTWEDSEITASKLSTAKIFKWTGDLPQNVNYAIKTGYLNHAVVFDAIQPQGSSTASTGWLCGTTGGKD